MQGMVHRLQLANKAPRHPTLPAASQLLACTCYCAMQSFELSSAMPASQHGPVLKGTTVEQQGKAGSGPALPFGKATAAHWPQQLQLSCAPLQKPTSTFAPRFLRRNVHSTGSSTYPNRLSGGQDANGALDSDALKAGLGKAAAGGAPLDPILGGELVVRIIDAQVSLYYFGVCCTPAVAAARVGKKETSSSLEGTH